MLSSAAYRLEKIYVRIHGFHLLGHYADLRLQLPVIPHSRNQTPPVFLFTRWQCKVALKRRSAQLVALGLAGQTIFFTTGLVGFIHSLITTRLPVSIWSIPADPDQEAFVHPPPYYTYKTGCCCFAEYLSAPPFHVTSSFLPLQAHKVLHHPSHDMAATLPRCNLAKHG